MKVAGIICEYNPFHNGHKYQIEMLKKEYDAVVCIMSGSFVQRGDVAIFDKWTRAKAALLSGCDLVIELPVLYVLSSAQGFSKGAVKILSSTGVIDALSFGSESGNIIELTDASEHIINEPPEVSEKIKRLLKDGYSYPKARMEAYKNLIDPALLDMPNNILALEYICELKKQKSNIIPITHKRTDNGYHSNDALGDFASATSIRNMIFEETDYSRYVPFDYTGTPKHNINALTDIFKYILLTKGISAFDGIEDMEPGLANRFMQCINNSSLGEIIDEVKTKRYTRTRLQRIALRVILGITENTPSPDYIRILGMSKQGASLIAKMKKSAKFPIVNKVADFKENSILPDILATDIAGLCAEVPIKNGQDYYTSPLII